MHDEPGGILCRKLGIYINQKKTAVCNVALVVNPYQDVKGWFEYYGYMWKNRQHQKLSWKNILKQFVNERL